MNGHASAESQVVIITDDGASGIGEVNIGIAGSSVAEYAKEAVYEFARRGSKIALADRNVKLGTEIAAKLTSQGSEVIFVELDIANEASVDAAIAKTVEHFGKLDAAVNCAGIGGPTALAHEIPTDKWQLVMDIDLTGTFFFGKACVKYWLTQEPRLIRDETEYGVGRIETRGALVNIASVNSRAASAYMGGYVAAKHGVAGFSKNLALENAQNGIRVNTINPGCVFTPIMQAPGFSFESVKGYLAMQAYQRFAHPAEMAPVLYFLCSDEASFCTGQEIFLDMGWTSH